MKHSRVLVTGGAGFIGSNLTERLLTLGAQIRASIHKKEPVVKDGRIEYVRADLTKREDCERLVNGIDCVFMCAASTSGGSVPGRMLSTSLRFARGAPAAAAAALNPVTPGTTSVS